MEKIDRLGWAAALSIASYGLRVGIRANQPDILEVLSTRLPPESKPAGAREVERLYSLVVGGAKPGSGLRKFHVLYGDAVRLARSMELSEVLEALETDLQHYVADRARRRVFVHAGVVGWRGRAIVVPGRSMSGKSTLVAALVRAGATYYSDEYAVFDARGRVHPYARALSLRNGPSAAGNVEPGALGGRIGTAPLAVGAVVITRYRAGARWRPSALSHGRVGIELLAHTVSARRRPDRALPVLARALAGVPVLKGVRGEAAETVDALLGDGRERRSIARRIA